MIVPHSTPALPFFRFSDQSQDTNHGTHWLVASAVDDACSRAEKLAAGARRRCAQRLVLF